VPLLTAVSNCSNHLTLNLTGNSAGSYQVRIQKISPTASAPFMMNSGAVILNLTIGSSGPGTYEIAARRLCGTSFSAWSCPTKVQVAGACAGPQNVVVSNIDCYGFGIGWTPVSGCATPMASYRLAVKKSTASTYNYYNIGLTNDFTMLGLQPYTLYNAFVQGKTSCNTYTQPSEIVTVYTDGIGCRDDQEQTAVDETHELLLYPNPTSGSAVLMLPASTDSEEMIIVECFDAVGRTMGFSIDRASDRVLTLDLSGIPSGMYFLRIRTSRDSWSQQIVVQR
jgi:hypothetical protein